jgi:hypothetical protein
MSGSGRQVVERMKPPIRFKAFTKASYNSMNHMFNTRPTAIQKDQQQLNPLCCIDIHLDISAKADIITP